MLWMPGAFPSVQVVDACPLAFVMTLVALRDPPPVATAKVTVALSIASPAAFLTVTVNGVVTTAPTVARTVSVLWGVMVAGTTSFFFGSVELPHAASTPIAAIRRTRESVRRDFIRLTRAGMTGLRQLGEFHEVCRAGAYTDLPES
jgi:hypothetical protein